MTAVDQVPPPEATGDVVRYEQRGAVVWVRLNRPQALNALTPDVFAGIDAALDRAAADERVRVVVLTGTGRAFCAGVDLTVALTLFERGEDVAFLRDAGRVYTRLAEFPKPVIAALNGLAMAGGLELLLCCDLVVAAASARIGDGHANYGLLPGGGATGRLPQKIGITRATHLLFTGQTASAAEMHAAGLINIVLPHDDLDDAVDRLAAQIAAKSPLSLHTMKRLLSANLSRTLPDALRAELDAFTAHRDSADMREGLAAFRDKRPPNFRGR